MTTDQHHGSEPPGLTVGWLLWREQIRNWPAQAWFWARRLLRVDRRQFLHIDGWVVAKFTRPEDAQLFLAWLAESHTQTLAHGMRAGREHGVADIMAAFTAGD